MSILCEGGNGNKDGWQISSFRLYCISMFMFIWLGRSIHGLHIGSKLYRSRLNEFPIMAFSRLQMLFALRAPMALLSCTDSQQVEQNAWWNTFYIHLRKKTELIWRVVHIQQCSKRYFANAWNTEISLCLLVISFVCIGRVYHMKNIEFQSYSPR